MFSGGTRGLGAAINDMMNAFSDVVSSPTDITARTVVLTRLDETAARMPASDRINEISTPSEQLQSSVTAINNLATQMAASMSKSPVPPATARANDLDPARPDHPRHQPVCADHPDPGG